jgi:type I restriction enzyme S subunit
MSDQTTPPLRGTPPSEGNAHPKDGAQNSPPLEGWQAKPDGVVPKLRFPEYRGAGEWEVKPFDELFTIGNGKDYKHLSTGDVPVYGSGGYMLSVNDCLYDGESVCIGRKGTINNPMFLTGKFWTVDTLFYTHSFNDCLPRFIYSIFQNIDWLKHNEAGGVPSLSKTNIGKIKVAVPKPKEQQKIADCLASLDERITLEAQKLVTLKTHKKGLMQQLFPADGETLPKLRFPEFRDAEEWEERNLGRVAENLDNRRVPITSGERVAGKIPYYGASGVVDYVKGFIFDEDLLCVSEDGANLVARTYPIAFPISGKTWVNNHAHVLRFENPCTQKFVDVYLNSIKLDDFITGMAQPKLNKAMLDSIPIPWPTVPEQQRIADCLTSLDDLITAQTQKLAALKTHKKGLMQQLFPSVGGVAGEA